MTINTLETCLLERGLVGVNSLEDVLRDTVIGVDFSYYLRQLIATNIKLTSNKSLIFSILDKELANFAKFGIRPVFVFNGLKTVANFNNNNNQKSGFNIENKEIINYFITKEIDYLIAPISAWSQLNYMYQESFVDAVFGPLECLLTNNIDCFILSIDWFVNLEIRFVDKKHVLKELKISHKQLKEISIVVGFDLQPKSLTKNFSFGNNVEINFKWLIEFVINGNNVYGTLLSKAKTSKPTQDDLSIFKDALTIIEFMPILKSSGRVEFSMEPHGGYPPLDENGNPIITVPPSTTTTASTTTKSSSTNAVTSNSNNRSIKVPSDIHEVVGQRLPHEYYFYLSIGLISTKLLENLIYDEYIEDCPTNDDSRQLRSLVTSNWNINNKNKILSLLTSPINRYFQVKKFKILTYFNGTIDLELRLGFNKPLFLTLCHYYFQNVEKFELNEFLIDFVNKEDNLKNCVHPLPLTKPESTKLNNINDILSTNLLRLLIIFELISYPEKNSTDPKLSSWGNFFVSFLKENQIKSKSVIENLFVLIVLLINNSQVSIFKPLNLINIDKKYNASIIDKLLLFYSINNQRKDSFFDILKYFKNQLFETMETLIISSLSNDEINKTRLFPKNNDWKKFIKQIPFKFLINLQASMTVDEYFTNNNNDLSSILEIEEIREFIGKSLLLMKQAVENDLIKDVNKEEVLGSIKQNEKKI